MTRVAILGGSGYTALELIRILLPHPHAEIVAITSRQEEGVAISHLHHSLYRRCDLACEAFDADRLAARGVECAFGCLPHGASMTTLPALLERGIRVVDLSADYRLRDPAVYARWYGEDHHDAANLARAVYGLPEIYGEQIAGAELLANPGCYPQTAILGLAPLVAEKWIDPASAIVDAKSGVSGAGRNPKLHTHFPECNESLSAYAVGTHRHTPEMEQVLSDVAGEPVSVLFTPHLVPMDRGIFATIYAMPRRSVSEKQLHELFCDYYARAPFVRIVPHLPATKDCQGTNYLDIAVKMAGERIVILACEDNLVRGASGVAVQNFNRMFGYEETTGLL